MRSNKLTKQKLSMRVAISALTICAILNTQCVRSGQQFGIIFSANLDGNQDLYRAYNADFQTLERITHTPFEYEQDIKTTKYGERILFSVLGKNLGWGTYLLDLTSQGLTSLGDPAMEMHSTKPLTWSFDESRVVLLEKQTGKIYEVNPNNLGVKELEIFHPVDFSTIVDIDYSPDGKRIAFTGLRNPVPPLSAKSSFVYDFETKSLTLLVDSDAATCDKPRWSPSGKQILVNCDLSTDGITENYHLYILEVVGKKPVTIKQTVDLPCGSRFSWAPDAKYAWSPDGKQFIATYCRMEMGNAGTIFIFNSDGSLDRSFSPFDTGETPIYVTEVSWSPDGQKILYIAGENEGALNIYMINADGTNNRAITSQLANYEDLSIFQKKE